MTNVVLPRTNHVGDPWLSRSVTSGNDMQISRTFGSEFARLGLTDPSSRSPTYRRPMDPKGKVAVVTGAAGGIGGALVRALVGAGATKVIATDLEPPRTSFAPDTVVNAALDVTDG